MEPTDRRAEIAARNALVASLAPIILFVLLFAFLFYWFRGSLGTGSPWLSIVNLFAIFLVAALAALGARALLTPLLRLGEPAAPAVPVDPNALLRSRIAPFVLALGGAAILILTLALIVAFAYLAGKAGSPLSGNIDSLLLGVFGSVLPILATWVGTVIAFYFTNESYRQAAEATREATAGLRPSGPKVTERMIPFEKIARIERGRQDARAVTMAEVDALMNEPVTRVIIFDGPTRSPVFVIRRKLYPSNWIVDGKANVGDFKVEDYLRGNGGANAVDAALFGFLPPAATLDEARGVMRDTKCADVFVTLTGQKTEMTLGWLTDDLLRSP